MSRRRRWISAIALSTILVTPISEVPNHAGQAAGFSSFVPARARARDAVATVTVDVEVLAQWTRRIPAHDVAYYQTLLSHARSYNDTVKVTARARADDLRVQARMRTVMPHKAIMVSLAEQALRAYEDGHLVMFTDVTTGRPALPTVTGHFSIYEKVTPWEFISPWLQGSPYYYPPTRVTYWMPFYSGYGLHDAWWRKHYGPGTNISGDGRGSGEPTGSHGCVNIPSAQAQWLWNWAPVRTPVVYGGDRITPGTAGI